jgi:excisionase family DNA binding protein
MSEQPEQQIKQEDVLLNSSQVCQLLAVSQKTLQRLTASGALRYILLSASCRRFRRAAVEAFLESRTVKAIRS